MKMRQAKKLIKKAGLYIGHPYGQYTIGDDYMQIFYGGSSAVKRFVKNGFSSIPWMKIKQYKGVEYTPEGDIDEDLFV